MTGSIPKDFIEELIARTDIVEIVDARITLKKKGTNHSACCPFHNEKTPSFSVSQPKQFYYCFGCGAHGNAIGFLMAYDKLTFPEAVEDLANHLGVPVPKTVTQQNNQQKNFQSLYDLMEQIAKYYQTQLNRSQPALAYLKQRGLTQETLQHFSVGYAPAGWDNVLKQFAQTAEQQSALIETGMAIRNEQGKVYDRFRERIVIPIRDNRGRVIGFGGRTLGDDTPKYLNSPETPLFHKGSELYGLYESRQSNQKLSHVLVVEGYMDTIALHQFGITQAVATLGTATTQKHLQQLFRHTENIIICFDGDRAGKEAAWRALEVSLSAIRDGVQIHFMFLPEGEDPDSLIRKEGKAAFENHIKNAISLPDFFFTTLCKEVDMETLEGKAKLSKLGFPLIKRIRNGVFQTLMLEKLSNLIGMPPEKLGSFYPEEPKPIRKEQISTLSKRTTNKTSLLSPIQLAMALLLQHPELVNETELPSDLRSITGLGMKTFVQLFDLIQANSNITTGALLENWRDSKIGSRLAELASCELLTPTEGLMAEFRDTLKKVAILERENMIQGLLNKADQSSLSDDEKSQLFALMKEKH